MTKYPNSQCDYSTIPDDLKLRPQWVSWKLDDVPSRDKLTKVPYTPASHAKASSTDSLTWGTFEQALAAFEAGRYDGIGFMFCSGDPYIFIDLDHAIDAEERARLISGGSEDPFAGLKRWAAFVRKIAPRAYIALSQSGTGLHVIMRGRLPGRDGRLKVERDGEDVGEIEFYSQTRFVALTGITLASGALSDQRQALRDIYRHFRPQASTATTGSRSPGGVDWRIGYLRRPDMVHGALRRRGPDQAPARQIQG